MLKDGNNLNVHLQKNGKTKCEDMEYYLVSKRNGIFIHATAWMNLEDIK